MKKKKSLEFDKHGRCIETISNIDLAKGIKFSSNYKGKILFYYTYIKKNDLNLIDSKRFKIDVTNFNSKEIHLIINPFLKTIGIDSEYKVYKVDYNETRNDLGKLIKTQPIVIFNDIKKGNNKLDFIVPIEGRKKYFIAVVAYSLDKKTQFNQTIYLPLEFDPDKIILPSKYIFYILLILIICFGVYYLFFKNKKVEIIRDVQEEMKEIDNYDKL
jgi:cbb3-type cytochrome oxidase subunit 3